MHGAEVSALQGAAQTQPRTYALGDADAGSENQVAAWQHQDSCAKKKVKHGW